jgi:serine protease inhibitor
MKKLLVCGLMLFCIGLHANETTIQDKDVDDGDLTLTIDGHECSPTTINADDVDEGDIITFNPATGYVFDQSSGVTFYCQ